MKKLVGLIFVPILVVLGFFVFVGFMQPKISVKYNNTEVQFQDGGIAVNGGQNSRIVAPVDILARAMGADVSINADEKSALIKEGSDTISLFDGKDIAIVNGKERTMPIRAEFKGGHVYTSIRFLCDNLNKSVYWNGKTSSLNIFDTLSGSLTLNKGAKDYISDSNFTIKNDKLLFFTDSNTASQRSEYTLQEGLNPNINKQIYSLAKVLVDKNFYLNINYHTKLENSMSNTLPYVSVGVSDNRSDALSDISYFSFNFYEKTPVSPKRIWKNRSFSQSSVIKLDIFRLKDVNGGTNELIASGLENKLKLAFVALFGESTGLNISDYLLEEYREIKADAEGNYSSYKKTRRFDNVMTDLAYIVYPDEADVIHVYFSYTK